VSDFHALVVSLHDVSPHTFETSRAICEELEANGVASISLLVVPDHHHKGHLLKDNAFLEWLKGMASRGHEVVIHGYYHTREQRSGESTRTQLITQMYTAGEGEFFDIAKEEAMILLEKARAEFKAAGFDPVGFIAPAWLLSKGGKEALKALRFQYTTLLREVMDLSNDQVYPSQSLVYSTRAAWRRGCSLAWNRFLFHRLESNRLVRLGIHPPDFQYPLIWQQILQLTRKALLNRQAVSYQTWLNAQTS